MSQVFISYSRKDSNYAMKLCGALETYNIPYFIDQERIEAGEKWPERLIEEVMKSEVFIVIMSPDSATSEWVNKELDLALRNKHHIMPLLVKGDVWGKLSDIQSEDVSNYQIPHTKFFALIRKKLDLSTAEYSEQSAELSSEHRKADLRLLQHLWDTINSRKITHFVVSLERENLLLEEAQVVLRHLDERKIRSELFFNSEELEAALQKFDSVLFELDDSIGATHTTIPKQGTLYLDPDYNAHAYGTDLYFEKLSELNEVKELGQKLLKEHKSLVATVKRLYPEFDFDQNNE